MPRRVDPASANPAPFSDAQIQSLLAAFPAPLCIVDEQLRYRWINDALAGINDLPAASHIGRTLADCIPAIADQVAPVCREVLTSGRPSRPVTIEGRLADNRPGVSHWILQVYPITLPEPENAPGLAINVCDMSPVADAYESEIIKQRTRMDLAIEAADLAVWECEVATGKVACNERWFAIRGLPVGDMTVTFNRWFELIHPADQNRVAVAWEEHKAGREPAYRVEYRSKAADGRWVWVLDSGQVIERGAEGEPLVMVGINIDVSQQKQSSHLIRSNEERLSLAQQVAGLVTWEWDVADNEVTFSGDVASLFGMDAGQSIASFEDWVTILHPGDRERVLQEHEYFLAHPEKPIHMEYRIIWPDGSVRWIASRGGFIFDQDGQPRYQLGANIDITDRKQLEHELKASERRFADAFQFAAVPMALLSFDGHFIFANPAMTGLLGYSEAQLREMTWSDLTHAEDLEAMLGHYRRLLTGEISSFSERCRYRTPSGSLRWVQASYATVEESNRGSARLIHQAMDITEQEQRTQELSFQASHDQLTGLYNRRAFARRLESVITVAGQRPSQHALAFLDLDHFKPINDIGGHDAGDAFLRQLSRELLNHLRQHDTLARLGGDEFALLIEHCSLDDAVAVTEKLRKVIGDFIFSWEGREFTVGVSIGVAPINAQTRSGEAVLRAADEACYAAKKAGRNNVIVKR